MIEGKRTDPPDGAERIAVERQRQLDELGYDSEHDDTENEGGELALAAACYAAPCLLYRKEEFANAVHYSDPWPWDFHLDDRPCKGNVVLDPDRLSRKNRIELLVKAGALIAAEIDRLSRIGDRSKKNS